MTQIAAVSYDYQIVTNAIMITIVLVTDVVAVAIAHNTFAMAMIITNINIIMKSVGVLVLQRKLGNHLGQARLILLRNSADRGTSGVQGLARVSLHLMAALPSELC